MDKENTKKSNDYNLKDANKVVGLKQTMRCIENKKAIEVYIAQDAEERIISKLEELAQKNNIKIKKINSMVKLGEIAGVKVKTSTLAILR